MKLTNILCTTAATLLALSSTVNAANRFWSPDGVNDLWSNPLNWVDSNGDSVGAPQFGSPEGDTAIIDAFDPPTTSNVVFDVDVPSGQQYSSIFVEDGYSIMHQGSNTLRTTFLTLGDTSFTLNPATPTTGTYTQAVGTVRIQQALPAFPYAQLILGSTTVGTGNYNLSGTGLLVSPQSLIGVRGTGNFNQTGGTYDAQISVALGTEATGVGTYTKSGAGSILNTGEVLVGFVGTGTFNHQGGTTTVTAGYNTTLSDANGIIPTSGSIGVGGSSGTGNFNLSGGTVNTGGVSIGQNGAGTFTHSGGTLNATAAVTVGVSGATTGNYNFSAGALNANTVRVGFIGAGSFVQTGGAADLDNLLISDRANGGAGSYSLQNGTLTVGALDIATNGTLQIANLKSVTVETDYDNASFGTGNSFNPKANVSGTGTLVASGNVVQTLSGNVTNGNTSAATMDFGIVHVGEAVTKNYQIANGGTSGPALRGAIQTNANGGSLTNSQLTGAGVTASNFGPIAASTNSGNLSVTLTGANAGVLTGQTVAIVNNFDNVTGQTLSITGQVNFYADPLLIFKSGAATLQVVSSTYYVLDFGNVQPNTGMYSAAFGVRNVLHDVTYQDTLGGSFDTTGANDFTLANFGSFSGIGPGAVHDPDATFDSASKTVGTYTDTVFLTPTSTNSSGSSNLSPIQIDVRTNVIPEPSAALLVIAGAVGLTARRRRSGHKKKCLQTAVA